MTYAGKNPGQCERKNSISASHTKGRNFPKTLKCGPKML